ncbi:hypothetical protein NP493_3619g00001 [Ridgeia piscesae]|uniref:Uncharacterized protein n=1 Tax=Ridgeia piscesae TaxID=27915 RepID=A0AAD9MV59_RIDPI|nr:hypothetical protein NP493_3619g00001 [Ridgeia piscesae]
MVVCDIRVAENLRQHFAEMLPVFKNNTDSRDYIGPFMRQYTKDNDMMSTQRRMLVGSYHGEKPLLATPSLQWYLSHGLVVDHVYQIIEFQPLSSLWKCGDSCGKDPVYSTGTNVPLMELSDTYTPEVSFTQHRRFINASTKRLFGRKTDLIITLIVPRIVDDDVELVEMSVVDKPGRFHVSTILYIYLLINVGHRLTVSPVSDYFHRICNGTSVKETPLELVRCSSFVTPTIHQEFSYALLPAVKLVSEGVFGSRRFPGQPIRSHMSIQLHRLRSKPVLFSSMREPSSRHVLHQCPKIEGIGVIAYDRATRLRDLT